MIGAHRFVEALAGETISSYVAQRREDERFLDHTNYLFLGFLGGRVLGSNFFPLTCLWGEAEFYIT